MERHFLFDKLPSELLHTICAYLKPTEVANLRLLSRAAALVGLHYTTSFPKFASTSRKTASSSYAPWLSIPSSARVSRPSFTRQIECMTAIEKSGTESFLAQISRLNFKISAQRVNVSVIVKGQGEPTNDILQSCRQSCVINITGKD